MKKIALFIAVLLVISLVVPLGMVRGDGFATRLHGHVLPSNDGIAYWFGTDDFYTGNITAIDINDPNMSPRGADDAIHDGSHDILKRENQFYWDATYTGIHESQKWTTDPDYGHNIMFLGEFLHHDEYTNEYINYTWVSNHIAEDIYTPVNMDEHVVRYEPIPKPVLNPYAVEAIGTTWINISIPNFKYTSSTIEGQATHRGNFDLLHNYAIFIREMNENRWEYIGNSRIDLNNPRTHEPIPAAYDMMDPDEINTGSHYFLAEDLKPDTFYEFMVRVNFRTLEPPVHGPVWGYGGGLGHHEDTASYNQPMSQGGGTITPFASSGGGGWVPTQPGNNPSEPLNLTAYTGINHIYMEWEEPSNDGGSPLTYYVIYRNTTTGFSYLNHITASNLYYSDGATVNGIEYTYYVTAVNDAGESSPSNQATNNSIGVASKPRNLMATASLDSIYVEWDPPSNNGGMPITAYWLYRDGSYYTSIPGNITYFTDHSVTNGVEYTYYVRPNNAVGLGPASDADSAIPYTLHHHVLSTSSSSNNWLFFSLVLIPEDTDIEYLLNHPTYGINGSYQKVMYYDASLDSWSSYVPGRAAHYNCLMYMDNTMGIWIQLTENVTFTIKGVEPVSTDITLSPGWNMVGYPSTLTGNNGLPSEVIKIGYFESTELYNVVYDTDTENFDFQPGNAYWIYNGDSYPVIWTVDY